jgi:hypothetical protein
VWTRPLRKLTPRTSYGYAVIHFAAVVLQRPLDPWQQWLVIHAGEMLDDGRPRFKQVLVIVGRQNGKTHLCTVLALFWLYAERWPLVFGTSNKLDYAKDSWENAKDWALETPALAGRTRRPRVGNGAQDLPTADRCHYRIGAANEDGGRSKSIDRAIGDELRQQRDWSAYLAMMPALNARPKGQVVFITNMGDDRSVVLNSLRADALDSIADGQVARPVGLFEWSAPPGSHPMDVAGWAAANPQLGRRNDYDDILQAARRVSKPGADPQELAGFLTEILCLGVDNMDPAVAPAAWAACLAPAPIDLEQKGRLAACVDVSPDQQHATLSVATRLEDDRARVELVESWDGPDALARVLAELPAWIVRIRPKILGWFPGGPAATLDATLRDRRAKGGRAAWPPRGVTISEIGAETPAVAMGFSVLVGAGQVVHSGQARLDTQVQIAEKEHKPGERWVFTRSGTGHVDALYAAAGAVHLARTMALPRGGTRRIRTGTGD